MTPSSLAGIITAIATALIAVGGVITSITVLLPILRGTRQNGRQIGEVHTLVNQQATDARRYNERLIEALNTAGVPIPRDSSLRDPEGGPVM